MATGFSHFVAVVKRQRDVRHNPSAGGESSEQEVDKPGALSV